jgi:hypothetical protein
MNSGKSFRAEEQGPAVAVRTPADGLHSREVVSGDSPLQRTFGAAGSMVFFKNREQ